MLDIAANGPREPWAAQSTPRTRDQSRPTPLPHSSLQALWPALGRAAYLSCLPRGRRCPLPHLHRVKGSLPPSLPARCTRPTGGPRYCCIHVPSIAVPCRSPLRRPSASLSGNTPRPPSPIQQAPVTVSACSRVLEGGKSATCLDLSRCLPACGCRGAEGLPAAERWVGSLMMDSPGVQSTSPSMRVRGASHIRARG
jgi:hypothetical protein